MLHWLRPFPTPVPMAADAPLHAEQIRLLFRFSLVGYLATLLVIFILGAILWEDLAHPALFIWFVSTSLVGETRVKCFTCSRHDVPGATRAVSGDIARAAGSSFRSPIWRDTS